MAEQAQGQAGEALLEPQRQLAQVLHQAPGSRRPKPAQILGAGGAGPVAPVVVDQAGVAFPGKELQEGRIPFLVFGHAVGDLHQAPGIALGQRQ